MDQAICIRNARWVVRWNQDAERHEYLRHADVAFTGDEILFVGTRYVGRLDEEIDGRALMVMPGLINIHCHPTSQPITRGVREEMANRALYMTALYDGAGPWRADSEALHYGATVAYGELLKSGVTTVVDSAAHPPADWIELMAQSGLRVFAAPGYRDASWAVEDGSRVVWRWDEADGRRQFEAAMDLVEAALKHPCGRLSAVIAPAQADTCRAETLREAVATATRNGLTLQTHAAQTLVEFHEMTRRTGITPIQWLHREGVLGPTTTLAHGIFVDSHSSTRWPTRDDIALLAESGATIAHCPVVFARYGQRLESFGGDRRAGVNMGIGTDTAPHNMLEEMRQAILQSRAATGDVADASAADVFEAATVGGARALGRHDLGRLAEGARADLVLVDLNHPLMQPDRDPLRNLIYSAAERAVRDVYIAGRRCVGDGVVLTLDCLDATARLAAAQTRAEDGVPAHDPAGRTGLEISPLTLPVVD